MLKITNPTLFNDTPSAFSVAEMSRLLHADKAETRERLLRVLSKPEFVRQETGNLTDEREQVLKWLQVLADNGFGNISFPEKYGGSGDVGDSLIVMEMNSLFDLSLTIKHGVQFGLFGGSIALLGTEKHHEKYLSALNSLALPGCFAMTELGHGSNVRGLETVATYDRKLDEFIIHTPSESARKEYIGNAAAHGRMATVFAQLEIDGERFGVNAFLVPIRDEAGNVMPSVKIEDNGKKMGLNGVDNGRLWFNHTRIPRENMLDRFAHVNDAGEYITDIESESRRFFTMIGTLVAGRIGVGISAVSAAKVGLTIATRYANTRRQFGPDDQPETLLIDYPSHQKRLIPLIAKTYGLHFALHDLRRQYTREIDNPTQEGSRDIETLAAALKAYSTWHGTNTLQEGREACGGQGFLAENRFASLKADSDIYTTFEGDNTVLMQLAAKGRLNAFQKQFTIEKFFGVAKYFAQQAATTVAETNIVTNHLTSSDHLRDREFHLDAMRYREENLLSSVAKRFRHYLNSSEDGYDAVLATQNHLLTLAHAYTERVIIEAYYRAIDETADSDLKAMLEKLATLFTLSSMEADKGWFLEQGVFSSPKSKAIRREVEKLNDELKYESLHLVNAFDIPDFLIGAPIATK